MVKAQLMVRVPFSDVMKSEVVPKTVANLYKVVKILLEKGGLMVGFRSRSEGIENDWGAVCGPMPKQLTSGFYVAAIEDAASNVLEFRLIYYYPRI